mmetsp:Transcript_80945/g.241225  ORF Transcript_80945/g.241225 Transcript_80945/m.241225 type:complete len:281 (-) Transcript_80945:134-976(-)
MEHRLPPPERGHQLQGVEEEGPQPAGGRMPPRGRPRPRLGPGARGGSAPLGGEAAAPPPAPLGRPAVRRAVLRAQHPSYPGRQGGRGGRVALGKVQANRVGVPREAAGGGRAAGRGDAAGQLLRRRARDAPGAGAGPRRPPLPGRAARALRRDRPRRPVGGHATDRRPSDDQFGDHVRTERHGGEGDGEAAPAHVRLLRGHVDPVDRVLPRAVVERVQEAAGPGGGCHGPAPTHDLSRGPGSGSKRRPGPAVICLTCGGDFVLPHIACRDAGNDSHAYHV